VSDIDVLKSGYRALIAGDVPTVLGIFDENITWHYPGKSPLGGTYHGHDEVVAFFTKLGELSGGTFAIEPQTYFAAEDGSGVVVLAKTTGQRNGRTLDMTEVHGWSMADGKATDFWANPHDLYLVDEFWS